MKNNILKIVFLLFSLNTNSQCLIRDTSFGTGAGVYNYNNYSYVYPIMLNDNKYLSQVSSGMIARFNENGSLDSNFGINGEFIMPNGALSMRDISVKNGYIYIVGERANNPTTDAFILRLTYDGVLDATFGVNGIVTFNTTENDEFQKVLVAPNNQIIAFGIKYTNPWKKLLIARFNSDGTVDTTFQNNGYEEMYVFPVNTETVQNVSEIQSNRYYIACSGQPNYGDSTRELVLLKLDLDGNLDSSLNGTGRLVVQSGANGPSYVKFLGNQLCYMTHGSIIYTNSYIHKFDISTSQSQVITVDYAATDYFFTNNFSKATVISHTSLPGYGGYKDLWIKTYNINNSPDTSLCNTGIYQFNLSDANNFLTDDIAGSIFLVNDKILVSGRYRQQGNQSATYMGAVTRFVDSPLSTDSFIESQISAFPNPVDNMLHITTRTIEYPISVEIVNLLGQSVLKFNFPTNDNNSEILIDVSILESSQYFLKLTDRSNKKYDAKFLKK